MSCHVMPSTDHYRKIAEISMTILPNVQGVEALRSRAGLPDTWKWRRDVRSVAYTHVSLCVVCMNMCRYVPLFTAPHTANSSSALHATPYTTLHNTLHNVILQTTASHLAPHSLHSPPLLFTASPYIIVIITDLTLHPFRAARKERSLRLA